MGNGLGALGRNLLQAALWCVACVPALACDGAQRIRLKHPVEISAQELAELRAMEPLRVVAVDAPPMSRYDKASGSYTGIGIDVWCFITNELGLRYEIAPGRDRSVADKIRMVQQDQADVFIPLSHKPDRAWLGIFTQPYYEGYYAIITRKDRNLPVHGINELGPYRVGVVKGVALEPRLQAIIPATRLTSFDQTDSDGMFQALLHGQLDAIVFNKNIFEEKRYAHDYFDLEVIYTLRDSPREYSFYFSAAPQRRSTSASCRPSTAIWPPSTPRSRSPCTSGASAS